jgi:tetratricopeptide (TPR) repeat protein
MSWIIEGSAIGAKGRYYAYMIETIAYALSSIDFTDTTAGAIAPQLSRERRFKLDSMGLTSSYDGFVRTCAERVRMRMGLVHPVFLSSLQKDSARFSQPFFSVLRAINNYYAGEFTGARDEALKVFRSCSDPVLNARMDQLRMFIDVRRGRVSTEVFRYLNEASKLEAKGDVQNAKEQYQRVVTLAPNFAYGVLALGKFYNRIGDPIRAINCFERTYLMDTLCLSAYREAATRYLTIANFKPMIGILMNALKKGNDYWEVNSSLGTAYLGDGDPARAIKYLERALALNAKSYRTNIQLGLAYQAVRNYNKARGAFNNALQLDFTRPEAVEYLTQLNDMQRNKN